MAELCFDQPEKLQKLNAIVHPAVNEKIREEMQKAQEREKSFYSEADSYGTGISWHVDEICIFMCHRRPDGATEKFTRIFVDEKMRCLQISR